MAFLLQQVGTAAAVNTGIAAITAPTALEQAFLARIIASIQTEVTAMGAANQVSILVSGTHTEKTCSLEFQIDKATPVLGVQLVQLSNASVAN